MKDNFQGKSDEIKVKRTTCPICTKSCVINAAIRGAKAISVDVCTDKGFGEKNICVLGQQTIEYVYHKDRIKTPLRRTGKRGEGRFAPITWDQAYKEIALKLNSYKKAFGADSVVFFTGWQKWYRFMLHRLAYSFGSVNYGTESSTCFLSRILGYRLASGYNCEPDVNNAGVLVFWSLNDNVPVMLDDYKKKGVKIVVIDPKLSIYTQKYADIHLRLLPGSDAALAHAFARIFIHSGWIEKDFISKHVYGFEDYAKYVEQFTPEVAAGLTGLTADEITATAELIMKNGPMASIEGNTGIIHHTNGMQTFRAINALSAITGNFDIKGGAIPSESSRRHSFLPKGVLNLEFINEKLPPQHKPMIGAERFPLWNELQDEFQAVDMPRHILSNKPYPLKAIFALGMNARMFPNDKELFEALKEIEFFVDVDLFMTDTAKYADIVLPACSSLERSELLGVMGALAFIEPVIEPLYESKSDMDIICELAEALKLDDSQLRSGYEACCRYVIRNQPFSFDELRTASMPIKLKNKPYVPGDHARGGYDTPTTKYELKSTLIEATPEWGLDALPTYADPLDKADPIIYPYILVTGVRYPYLMHSRAHRLESLKVLRPNPAADINPQDAEKMGIEQGSSIKLKTSAGEIKVKANITKAVLQGTVGMHHGYSDADINSIIPAGHYDPYSGFPGFKSVRCAVVKR